MAEYIEKQAAIKMICSSCAVDKPESCSTIQEGDDWCEEVSLLLKTPAADVVPYSIEPDGTLTVTVPKGMTRVGRILIEEDGTQYGGLFYPDTGGCFLSSMERSEQDGFH